MRQDVERRVIRALRENPACMHQKELFQVCELLEEIRPKSILELGVKNGGSLNMWSKFAHPSAILIGVDIVPSINHPIGSSSQSVYLIIADCDVKATREKVKRITDEVDFLFLDANHRYYGVREEFRIFAPLVREEGLVAIHDTTDEHVKRFVGELKDYFPINSVTEDCMGIAMFKFNSSNYQAWKERYEMVVNMF